MKRWLIRGGFFPGLALLAISSGCWEGGRGGGDAESDSDVDSDTDSDADADTDTHSDTETDLDTGTGTSIEEEDECEDGWIDCDGEDANGCETEVEDAPPEYFEYGCCHPFSDSDEALVDCDEDGYCECYGVCCDPPYEDECCGE